MCIFAFALLIVFCNLASCFIDFEMIFKFSMTEIMDMLPPPSLQNEAVLRACSEPPPSKNSGGGTDVAGDKDSSS